jgi:hypothetical protein
MAFKSSVKIYFSDFFNVTPDSLEKYGTFNVSLVTDLPLFIDPFLLFNSKKKEYQELHDEMIKYLRFLRDKSAQGNVQPGLIAAWYRFPEVKQNHFGFCLSGNSGRGLGNEFAQALDVNLQNLFSDFGSGQNKISKGHHLEKLCLIRDRVGKDFISDFTTNLIKGFLLKYTEAFAKKNIDPSLRKTVPTNHVSFNYKTETWERQSFDLPFDGDDYVLLTPKDILTKDDIWINKNDLIEDFSGICSAIPNGQLVAQIDSYFKSMLPRRPKQKDKREAARKTILRFKELIDYYIKYKEDHGGQAVDISNSKVTFSLNLYVHQFGQLAEVLQEQTKFYQLIGGTKEETYQRILFLKDVIENKDGYKIFYHSGHPIQRESDLQILFRLTWCGTSSDVNREVNNGRGPADFVVSRGAMDKGLVEMKLASNTALKKNLEHQLEIYKKASDGKYGYKVIIYFTSEELAKVRNILRELDIEKSPWVILIDAREDNKLSASKAVTH